MKVENHQMIFLALTQGMSLTSKGVYFTSHLSKKKVPDASKPMLLVQSKGVIPFPLSSTLFLDVYTFLIRKYYTINLHTVGYELIVFFPPSVDTKFQEELSLQDYLLR